MAEADPQFDPDDFEGIQEKVRQLPVREIKRFERDRRELAEVKAERDTLRREQAFLRAGINVDDPAARYFVKGYDGDLAPEAIKAAAIEARLIASQGATEAEQAGHAAATAAAAGADAPAAGVDVGAEFATLRKKMESGGWRDPNAAQEVLELARTHGVDKIDIRQP